jgi:hypothetical protein
VVSGPTATGRPQNISGATFHVESMPAAKKVMDKFSFTDWAKLMSAHSDESTLIDRQYNTREYLLVGKVKTLTGADAGWYMIKQEDGTVGYRREKYF